MDILISIGDTSLSVIASSRRLKSVTDGFRKRLGRRDGTHVDNYLIDLAIFVQMHLIDRLKLLALDLAHQSSPASAVKTLLIPGAVLAT